MARAANQPAFDFLTGGEISPARATRDPPREAFRQSTAATARADHSSEGLRAQLKTLQYELDAIKQERELLDVQHEQELRDAQVRAEADFKRAQAAEAAGAAAACRVEALQRDYQDARDRAANEKLQLEKRARELQADGRGLREELDDAQAELAEAGRRQRREHDELLQRHDALQAGVADVQADLAAKVAALQAAQQRLSQREAEAGQLENEVLRLRAQAGDTDTLALVKKELSEQVEYIRRLESTGREQLAELHRFRKVARSVEVVEEEKRALEAKVRMMDDLRRELAEAQLQRRILEDEKQGWTSYLETEGAGAGEEDMKYETPEQMAKAFLHERLERLNLADRLGSVQPELTVKDENIRSLEDGMASLRAELEKMRALGSVAGAGAGEGKARARLERQKNLAMKEVEYLRAQMKTFEAEEAEFSPDKTDEQHSRRVHELEDMVEQYRSEVSSLHAELSKSEPRSVPQSPKKRSREEDEDSAQRLGELQRKARALQEEFAQLQNRNQYLEAELRASGSQIASLKESSRTRVLELRSNPTAEMEAIKMKTLATLREENAGLLAQLSGKAPAGKVVPISALDGARLRADELAAQLAATEKKTLRLKQIWSSKSLEFREAVASILGWRLDFMPNGRVRATSVLHPSTLVDGEEEENSIVFDGENGTMKVSGGPQSVFAQEIRGLIEFWVEGRKEVPCFLAACSLEFYDRTTRAQKM